jgi:hypothetical protein
MSELFDRRSDNNVIERSRVLSDNYNAFIINPNKPSQEINLSDLGLKRISWESRDDTRTWIPCTRAEEICIVIHKGFDLELTWAKNAPDLMTLFTDQHIAYHNGLVKQGRSVNVDYLNIGNNKRTPSKDRGKVDNSPAVSNFYKVDNRIPTYYITPKFDLRIEIQHYSATSNNSLMEKYTFKNVSFYKPSQSTEENSAEIVESIKAHASYVERPNVDRPVLYNGFIKTMIMEMLEEQLQKQPSESVINQRDRKIINSDLTDITLKRI